MNIYMTLEGVGGLKFPREELLWEKEMARRWPFRKRGVKSQRHYRKEEYRTH